MPRMRKGVPKEETFSKYGGDAREVGIDAIGKLGGCRRIPFSGVPEGDL